MIPFRENGTHYKITGQERTPVKIWRNSDARVLLAPFLPFSKSWLFNHVTRAQFVVLSMAFFTFILYKSELLQIGTILVVIVVAIKFLLLLRILRNLWTVGLWAFFNFVLFRYERLHNLLFLVLIRCLLSLFLWLQWKFLLLLRFLRHLRSFQGPSSPFFFLSLEFGYVCYSCYSCHICYSVLLDSGFLEALLGLFSFYV